MEARQGEDPKVEPTEEGLELDRMEVQPVTEHPDEAGEGETEPSEPDLPAGEVAEEEEDEAPFLDYKVLLLAGLLLLGIVSAGFWLLFAGRSPAPPVAPPRGRSVHVIKASLGGEYYVHFNLSGPFRDPEGERRLERSLPKIRNELILWGTQPEVMKWVRENDVYSLGRRILEAVSETTGIPVEKLKLRGLAVMKYSDEAAEEDLE